LGVVSSYLGFILALVGLVAGFYSLPSGNSETIGFWLSWVPIGFILLLAGITATQLSKK
jgi:formate hydrogenlyase subunit 3/multisubunit Na+/H+ antiporter MnhD subunit